jgi:hypothetical protein
MNDKAGGSSGYSTIRGEVNLEFQVNEQIRIYRMARNMQGSPGSLIMLENAISCLHDILSQWMPPDMEKLYDAVRYSPAPIEDLYTPEDMDDIVKYGELDDDRITELRRRQAGHNMAVFYRSCDERMQILMKAFRMLGLGFKEEEDAEISHDKKKGTTTATS